jgi:glycolate oxidase FAD binding subunit
MGTTELARALEAIVGPGQVLPGDIVPAYAVDGRTAPLVAFPASVDEVRRVLGLAWERGLGVVPAGAGTRLGWGGTPLRLDLVLALRRLDRLLAHEPADLTLSVEAGFSLGALNDRLRDHRQFLPLDPSGADHATVGGLVATAASGPYRARYGTMRDLLLGVTVVRADGTLIKGGGRVVKNVTGYDIPKLLVGSLGTLGVVVEAHLRLHPRPDEEATWAFGFPSAEAALEAALAVRDTPIEPSRLQLVDGPTLARIGEARPPAAALAVTVGSVAEAVRVQGARVGEICRRGGGELGTMADASGWWRAVSDAAAAPDGETTRHTTVVLRIGTRPSDVVKALRATEAALAGAGRLRVTAEVANGVLHAVIEGVTAGATAGLVERIRESLGSLNATSVVEQAPPEAKPGLDVWGEVGPALATMRRLKDELDSRGVLNPGRFVGGI